MIKYLSDSLSLILRLPLHFKSAKNKNKKTLSIAHDTLRVKNI